MNFLGINNQQEYLEKLWFLIELFQTVNILNFKGKILNQLEKYYAILNNQRNMSHNYMFDLLQYVLLLNEVSYQYLLKLVIHFGQELFKYHYIKLNLFSWLSWTFWCLLLVENRICLLLDPYILMGIHLSTFLQDIL